MSKKDICFLSVFAVAIIAYIFIENKKINTIDRLARYTITERAIVYGDESEKMGRLYDQRYRNTIKEEWNERNPPQPTKQDPNSRLEPVYKQFQ
jgi:hypothetical protein